MLILFPILQESSTEATLAVDNKISTNVPTLQELSIGAIFGVDSKESVDQLKQLTIREIMGTAVLIKLKEVNLAKYESPLALEVDDRCLFSPDDRDKFSNQDYSRLMREEELCALSEWNDRISDTIKHHRFFSKKLPKDQTPWKKNPMYQVVYDKNCADVIKSYQDRRNEILSLPDMPNSGLTSSKEEILSCYHDPLYFSFQIIPRSASSFTNLIQTIDRATSSSISELDKSMSFLEENRCRLNSRVHIVAKASSMQLKHSLSLLKESLLKRKTLLKTCNENQGYSSGKIREMSIIGSLDVIISVRKVDKDFNELKEKIIPVMKSINFMSLEDRIESLNTKISNALASTKHDNLDQLLSSLSVTSSSLKRKYHSMIERRRLRIGYLLEKINLGSEYKADEKFLEPIFVESMNNLIKKISLSRESESSERDKKLFDPALIESSNYLLKKINPGNMCSSGEKFLEPVFIESILLSVKKMILEIAEMEKIITDYGCNYML
ncbi:hypothetical protein [Candidatus Ichthyocystis hellenicum]|uniref:hypothetical protein n=2 Tax=Candidatus Ichthyocystis hellenicum TaxID=1561003 RepID=UPI000B82C3A7|nr:hypothetical protein [Candidatus Ichthyocystis hellenicum]